MTRNVTTLLWAAGLTVLPICGNCAVVHFGAPQWLAEIAFVPAVPAFFASCLFAGTAHEGIPPEPGFFFFAATFGLWAVVIFVIRWLR